jgi:hypothetical protein
MMDSDEPRKTVSFEKPETDRALVRALVNHQFFGDGAQRKTEKEILNEVRSYA